MLELDQLTALLNGIATANHIVELVQISQVVRLRYRLILVIVDLVLVRILTIVNVEILDRTPSVSDTLRKPEGIWCNPIVRKFKSIESLIDDRLNN